MSQLDNTSDMMAQLNASFRHTETPCVDTPAQSAPTAALASRRKPTPGDLDILAHAQNQLQSHLAASSTQAPDGTWQPQHQHAEPQLQVELDSHVQPQRHQHRQCHDHAPRPRSAQQFHSPCSPGPSHAARPDLRTPVAALPMQWWENDVLVSSASPSASDEDVRPSIEPAEGDARCVVQSIEPVVEHVEVKMEDVSDGDEARVCGEALREWNACVQHKESWVRQAGLKREREESGRRRAAKRSKV